MKRNKFILLLLCITMISSSILAQSFSEIIKSVATDRGAGHRYGFSVAMFGEYALVSSDRDAFDENGANQLTDAGAAYLLKKDQGGANNWGVLKKLVAPDRASNDDFGFSVALSEEYAVIGAKDEDHDANGMNTASNAGSVYVFKKDQGGSDNWGFLVKIVASDRDNGDGFGRSVGVSGDYIIVGASSEDHDENDANFMSGAGSAYIFKKDQGGTDNWGQIKKLVASDRASSESFGYSVGISGDYAVVGVYGDDLLPGGSNAVERTGSAYVFEKDEGGSDNWGQQTQLLSSDLATDDHFGWTVAISGEYIVVGAKEEDHDENGMNSSGESGSAYVFKRVTLISDWVEVKKLVASDRLVGNFAQEEFGHSVAISGDYITIGARLYEYDENGANFVTNAGAAYIFKQDEGGADNWGELQKIVASDREGADDFGWSVATTGSYTLIGAFQEDHDMNGANFLSDAGSAYIFENSVPVPVELTYFKGKATTEGNLLQWETASELNNEGFYIERSANSRDWETLDFQQGNLTTFEIQNYTYLDNTAPIDAYYRLKQVDTDGAFEYSNIVNITRESTIPLIRLYPNPVVEQLNIENGIGYATVHNTLGQVVAQFNIPIGIFRYNISSLPKGQYTLTIQKQNGDIQSQQFIK